MVSESKQPELYAALITTNVLAALAVSMRFLSRRLSRFKWWYDDWLILAAFVRHSVLLGRDFCSNRLC